MNKKPSKATNALRLGLFWAIVVLGVLAFWAINSPQANLKEVPLSDVVNRANNGKIAKIEIQGNELTVTPKGQSKPTERSLKENGTIYTQGLKHDKTEVKVQNESQTGLLFWNLAPIVLSVVLFGVLFMFMMRQAQGQNSQAMGFGKSG